jgi:hypothetical protein
MSIGLIPRDRAALARRLRTLRIPDWQEFIGSWMGFNAVYEAASGKTERERLMDVSRRFVSASDALRILDRCHKSIQFLTELPPGNTRFNPGDTRFRERSTIDLLTVNDGTAAPNERLAHLMAVVYQIRCNLVHGSKDPDNLRDRRLVSASHKVLSRVLEAMLPKVDAVPGLQEGA